MNEPPENLLQWDLSPGRVSNQVPLQIQITFVTVKLTHLSMMLKLTFNLHVDGFIYTL
jgi:hypothetical protein